MQGHSSCPDFKLVELLVLGPEVAEPSLFLPLPCWSRELTFLAEIWVHRVLQGRLILASVKVAQRLLLQCLLTIWMWFHLLLHLSFTWMAHLTEMGSLLCTRGNWSIFRAGGKTEARGPPKEHMKTWTPPEFLLSGALFHSRLLL